MTEIFCQLSNFFITHDSEFVADIKKVHTIKHVLVCTRVSSCMCVHTCDNV